MSNVKRELLSGWGLTPATHCTSFRPEKERDLAHIVHAHRERLIARGLGRSYGDAALQAHGVVKTERLDHLLDFDAPTGLLRAQAGVSLADVMAFSVPRGFLPPVIPGTRYVTLGGAFACNVHGKNQYKLGEFAEHVTRLRIVLADGRRVECSPHEQADLFWATAGGMGMTGLIEELTLRLVPIHSASLRTRTQHVSNIQAMVAAFEHARADADYMIGWIDHMAHGDATGRGVFESARHITTSEGGAPLGAYHATPPRLKVPLHAPSWLLNRYVMALYNQWRFARSARSPAPRITDLQGFFHPLDAIGHWNRLYGKQGFFQYQCLIPDGPDVTHHLRELLVSLHEEKLFSFLAVLKYHRDGLAPLSFSKAGYSLALDFRNTPRVRQAMPAINQWVAQHGGRVYLAKDALMSAEDFRAMYGASGEHWNHRVREVDPSQRFMSMMAERLHWKS